LAAPGRHLPCWRPALSRRQASGKPGAPEKALGAEEHGGGVAVVFITAPRGKGEEIARRILEERLAACVNVAPVASLYWWKGSLERDDEDLLIVKTSMAKLGRLIERVKEMHPYEVPEIVALPVVACLGSYCSWVREETRG
jgi:periplasmic divalent cation tolerance protein